MAKLSQFKIDLINLPDGINEYSYELGQKFFDIIDHEEVRKGNVNADLTVKKAAGAFEFNFHLVGTVQIPCDRCLDQMNQSIDTHNRLVVRLGDEYREETDEVVIIPSQVGTINIAWYLYEFIILDIPLKHVHEKGKCNKEMMQKYRKHQAVDHSDDDTGTTHEESDESDDSQTYTDPRWDELKKLK